MCIATKEREYIDINSEEKKKRGERRGEREYLLGSAAAMAIGEEGLRKSEMV